MKDVITFTLRLEVDSFKDLADTCWWTQSILPREEHTLNSISLDDACQTRLVDSLSAEENYTFCRFLNSYAGFYLHMCRRGGRRWIRFVSGTNWRSDSCKSGVSAKYSEAEKMWCFHFYKNQVLMPPPLFLGRNLLLSYFYVLISIFFSFCELERKLIPTQRDF